MQAFRREPIATKQDQAAMDLTKITAQQQQKPQGYRQEPPQSQEQFQQYKRIYLTAFILSTEKLRLKQNISKLLQNLETLQKTQDEYVFSHSRNQQFKQKQKTSQKYLDDKFRNQSAEQMQIAKRTRRKADDIQRKWECFEQYCGRKYGAHASLLQHVKLKHPDKFDYYCQKQYLYSQAQQHKINQ